MRMLARRYSFNSNRVCSSLLALFSIVFAFTLSTQWVASADEYYDDELGYGDDTWNENEYWGDDLGYWDEQEDISYAIVEGKYSLDNGFVISVTLDGVELVEDVDYIVTHNDYAGLPGTSSVTIAGIGYYCGSKTCKFTVSEPFADVFAAQNGRSGTPHYTDIIWLYNVGITTGFMSGSRRTFQPLSNVARCDMAV